MFFSNFRPAYTSIHMPILVQFLPALPILYNSENVKNIPVIVYA
jgi:hypothetical protein